ncbi:MAG: hypothetical protein CM15mP55_3050 [Hyphomicrobiales bacterium]|nr:MAG: hypothetical protein CM15mP55_3050 [Hyphomicrobiales bacterium]
MVFNLRDKFFVEQVEVGRHAETAVILVAARASGNLGQFRRCQVTVAAPVKFAPLGKCHMVDIHIQPHANGIGGDQKIHLARLIMATCALRVRGLNPPITTAAPPRCWRITSAMA